ncbi:MAG: penicillin-binding protein 2 [Chloroflexi bacterium]|nr:penicillin-binding protein 2 [Chloroflexota bacterium]
MTDNVRFRLPWIVAMLTVGVGLIVFRLFSIQFSPNVPYFNDEFRQITERRKEFEPPRGRIYDRQGELLATNDTLYEVNASPVFVTNPEAAAEVLAEKLNRSRKELAALLTGKDSYILIQRPVPATIGGELIALQNGPDRADLNGIALEPIPHREYPGGRLGSQILGFVGYDGRGYYGVEEFYNDVLAGHPVVGVERSVPFDAALNPDPDKGADLKLTIDRDIQNLVEETLQSGLQSSGATTGTIVVMDPKTGEILGMASWPTYDPNNFVNEPEANRVNPALSAQFEPGSIFKVLTMAAALESGTVTPQTTYVDSGVVEVGGAVIHNWNGGAWGVQDMTGLLQHSLNVGAATIARMMGPTIFYNYLTAFGVGQVTNVDLASEAAGRLKRPGDPDWYESDLGTNSFGQGVAVTPLQILSAISAVANGGEMMQPHVLLSVNDSGVVHRTEPTVLGRPISAQTARTLTEMLTVSLEREASGALVPGYLIAGKTGTAQIPIPGGYDSKQTIASFVGWGPVDDPRFIVLVKLDRPTTAPWGSVVAAPVFSQLAQRLVVLMQLPPDNVRHALLPTPTPAP